MVMMSKVMRMKWIMTVGLMGVLMSGCYVPMPSVGVKPTRVYHEEVCVHTPAGTLKCAHTRRYVK